MLLPGGEGGGRGEEGPKQKNTFYLPKKEANKSLRSSRQMGRCFCQKLVRTGLERRGLTMFDRSGRAVGEVFQV